MAESRIFTPDMVEAYDLCPTVVLVFEIEGFRIVAANAAAAEKYGYSREELCAMTIMDLRPPEEVPRITTLASRMLNGSDAAGRSRHLTKAGEEFIAEVHTRIVEMNGRLCKLAVIHDVTQQAAQEEAARDRLAEAAARERAANVTQRHFAELFNLAPGRCAILRPDDFRVFAVSDGYLEAIGMQRAEVIGQPLLELLSARQEDRGADESEPLCVSLRRIVETGQATFLNETDLTIHSRHLEARDAQSVKCVVANMPLKGPDESVSFVLHSLTLTEAEAEGDPVEGGDRSDPPVVRDLSLSSILWHLQAGFHSKQTMALSRELAQAEALLRTTERLLQVHVWRFDVDRQQLEWTDGLFALFGLPPESMGPTFDEYVAMVHPDDRDAMLANHTAFAEGTDRDFTFAHRIVRPDGKVIHVKGGAEQIIENNRTLLSGVVQDVTEQAKAREIAERRDYLMRVAARIGGIGAWRVDLKSQIAEWSPETARIHETPETREVGLQSGINFYAPEYRDRIADRFSACAEQGTPFDEVMQIITARGNRVWVRAVGEAERNGGNRIVAVRGAFQDLSDVVRTGEEHRALRSRLSRTLEGMSDAFFTLDENWRFTYVNKQCEILLQRNRDDLLGKNVWSEFPDAQGSRFETEYVHAIKTGESVEFTEYYVGLDRWFRVTAHPSPDGLAVYFRDVTSDRSRDQNLRLLNTAITRMSDILLITEAGSMDTLDEHRITYVNEAFTRLTGYTAEEAIGRTPHFLQGPETQRSELDRIRAALEQNQSVRAEVINYGKDGSRYWLEMDITPIVDAAGKTTHFVALERDTTEKREWQEDLRRSEERFQLVTNASKDVIWDWDVRAGSLWWSDKLATVFGHDIATTPYLATDITACVHPDDVERVRDGLFGLVESKGNIWQDEYRFFRADGRIAHIRDRAFALRDENGVATRVIGSMVDVTQEREIEAALRQTQKLDAIGQLTGGVAHDFNNLLTVILNNGDFLVEGLEDREDLRRLAEQVVDAAERGASLTSRLLAFARRQPLAPEVTSLNTATRSIEPLLRRSLGEAVEIEMVLAEDLWMVEIDPGQFESTLLNLAINARDAMPSGGRLTIETLNAWIDGETAAMIDIEEGQYAVVAVTDTGTGMSPAILDRVLEPFFTTKTAGSGLGLPMVYGFTKQSQGHLKIYSEVGEGTTVKLYFPRVSSDAVETRQTADNVADYPEGQDEHILVVEDDAPVRQNVVNMVRSLGYRVTEAKNAAEALLILEEAEDIALLFTDIVMPGGMNGRDLADAALRRRPGLRVLYTSGYTENAIVHQGRLDPGVNLLSKPYRRQELAIKLCTVLGRSRSSP